MDNQEYEIASQNHLHFSNMRFAQLTLYFALSAGLVSILFAIEPRVEGFPRLCLKWIGVVGSLAFFVMELRAEVYGRYFTDHAMGLEKELGYTQYTNRPKKTLLSTTNATRLLVLGGGLFWLGCIVDRW